MTCNMGKGDRIVRGLIGILILGAGYIYGSWWALIGLIFLGTALVSWCPAYVPFGINTGYKKEE